ncbi:glyoxalase domain-containing protein 4-like [Centruroides sculpturatus]|uniref:glyoxalase domain-containing protein 4-like n=1 Tax=Centruroides sculpturatus TaxID=218467 RepID=UPI000C6EC05E|nr:glyoxalase domain-containing protein 4-like [Centruroides sculpturatus]XP_023243862.1 glyoxalase domain-containing protein 4-like [Centruroides sculpturatus]
MDAVRGRALHFVFKVGDRNKTIKFYKDVLGMKVLRHEEFQEGCKAACNGPYDGKWSKTMVGYGAEDNHFVVELTYNYGIGSYRLGNDFLGITIKSSKAIENAIKNKYLMAEENNTKVIEAPGGYKFFLKDEPNNSLDPVEKVILTSSNLKKSLAFWNELLGMKVYEQNDHMALLGFADNQCKLELISINKDVDHATAFGRIAFACPEDQLPIIEQKVKTADYTILTPLISLDTPGKATVRVVIIADPVSAINYSLIFKMMRNEHTE